jgi:hypothetical protein
MRQRRSPRPGRAGQPAAHRSHADHPVQHAIIVAGRAREIADAQDGPLTAGRFEILLAARKQASRLISRPLSALTVSRAITTELPAVAESARRTSPVCTARPRNDPAIAPIACAQRAHMTGWSNVARVASSEVLPTI